MAAADAANAANLAIVGTAAGRLLASRYDVLRGGLLRLGKVFDLADPTYSAALDGSTDDSSALAAAVADAASNGGGIVRVPWTSGGMLINRVQITSSNILVEIHPGMVVKRTTAGVNSQGMLEFNGALTTKTTLSADATTGDRSITVGSTTGLSAGDWVLIQSDARITTATLPHLVEVNRVESVTDSTHLVLKRRVRNTYASSGTVHVDLLSPLTNVGVSGGLWQGPGGSAGDLIRFTYCVSPRAALTRATNFGDFAHYFQFCASPSAFGCEAYAGSDTSGGWGLAIHCCQDWYLGDCVVRDHAWDGFDIAGGSMYGTMAGCRAMNCADAGINAGHGQRSHHNTYIGCHTTSCAPGWNIGSSSYAGDDDNVFYGCTDNGCTTGLIVYNDSARNRFVGHRSAKTSSGPNLYVNSTTAVFNEFIDCTADSGASNGLVFNSPTIVRGGVYRKATGHGINPQNAAAAGSLIEDVEASENTGDGIHVSPATDVKVIRPRTWGNGGYGTNNNNSNDSHCEIVDAIAVAGKTADTSGLTNWSISTTHRITSGTAPTLIAGTRRWTTAYSSPTSATKLLGLAEGDTIDLFLGDANITLVHTASPVTGNMVMKAGANITGSGKTIRFQVRSGVLYEW